MIKYALCCSNDHQFESWFESSAAYDKLDHAGLLTCIHCGASDVRKALMAPNVALEAARPEETRLTQTSPSAPAATGDAALREKISAIKDYVEKNSTYVGRNFAREARDMHDGLVDEKPIYGEATAEETKSLLEDGIGVLPLPFTPKSKTN